MVSWLQAGGLVLRGGKAWLTIFVGTFVTCLVLVALLGVPTGGTDGVFLAVFCLITLGCLWLSFGPVTSVGQFVIIIAAGAVYYMIAAAPGTFVAGFAVGVIKRLVS